MTLSGTTSMSKPTTVFREVSRWSVVNARTLVLGCILTHLLHITGADDPHIVSSSQETKYHTAYINISYMDRDTKKETVRTYDGRFGTNSVVSSSSGVVMHTVSLTSGTNVKNNYGCTHYINSKFPSEPWIALIERGECSFTDKIKIATKDHNATAVVIYDNEKTDDHLPNIMNLEKGLSTVSVLMSQSNGKEIARLVELGYTVRMQIIPGPEKPLDASTPNSISKTSVLFVSISFIVLMIISLAWLVFYYIQRFRYSHAKERLARRLVCAAKKAIAKIPQRTVKVGDKELDCEFDQCAVCIEPYKAHDVIRILPCRHVFHKSCVDPWLLDQRTCPMCKLDILRAFGMQIGTSQESVHPDAEAGPVITIVQEPEMSSSMEDTQTEEIKVLLVPHTCLHFRSDHDKVAGDDEEASCSLLGAVGGPISNAVPANAPYCVGPRFYRTEKGLKADRAISEMETLIGRGNALWHSRGEGYDDDDDDDNGIIDVKSIRDIESIMNVIENDNCEDVKISQEDDVEVSGMDSSSRLSLSYPSLLSSEQLQNHAVSSAEGSEPTDERLSKDSNCVIVMVGDDSSSPGNIAHVEYNEDVLESAA